MRRISASETPNFAVNSTSNFLSSMVGRQFCFGGNLDFFTDASVYTAYFSVKRYLRREFMELATCTPPWYPRPSFS